MKNRKRQEGFTLVELIIAMFLLVTALLGTAAVTATVINGNAFSRHMTEATTLAQDKMEEIMGMAYQDMSGLGEGAETVSFASVSYSYDRRWRVVVNSPAANMATIDVEVRFRWKETDEEDYPKVSISTVRSQ